MHPSDFETQRRLAWRNVEAQLAATGMTLDNLDIHRTYLADRRHTHLNRSIRNEFLGGRETATRRERTLAPQGERRTLFARDLVGSADEILDALYRDRVLAQVRELRLDLPYNFEFKECEHILNDFVSLI